MVSLRYTALVGLMLVTAGGRDAALRAQAAKTVPSALFSDLRWQCIGPFDGGPVASVTGKAGEAGVYVITTPAGDAWQTADGGDSWRSIARENVLGATSADPRRWIDPANPRRIARTDAQGIEVSLDGGTTWVASHHLPIANVEHLSPHDRAIDAHPRTVDGKPAIVSMADPARPGLLFAGTNTGVEVSFDNGAAWQSLALNMPAARINDLDIRGNDLVAATDGRSTWILGDISPLRQLGAASAAADAILFKPADAVLVRPATIGVAGAGADLDYYLGPASHGDVTLEILDATGRVVHQDASAASPSPDLWLAAPQPLPATPGHHRIVWDLHFTPPPSPHHRFARSSPALLADVPPNPNGPRVLPGTYRVRLTVGAAVHEEPLVVRDDPHGTLEADEAVFDLAMKADEAMDVAHRAFLQLARTRAALHPLLASADPDLAATATALDTRLNDIDGSDWTGLVIPDADDEELGEVDEKEGKHPDFVPPKAVSLTKDYDDPTSILGRAFGNVDHAPAFAILATTLGGVITKVDAAAGTPDSLQVDTYDQACQQLASVLETWRGLNEADLPQLNGVLAAQKLPALPIATNIPSIACAK